MALSIADQIALDDALVAPADRLKIGKCNLRLSSDITSKEATLQVVYDVLKLTPFYKAFQVTADAPEIYMQEFRDLYAGILGFCLCSQSIENLPNFASLFGFDHRLKVLEDNFSEFRQTNQYADALSSIPGTVDQYLANKMQEAVDVAVQLKYDRFREESTSANQQFLDSIDEGMKKIIKDQVKKEVSKVIPKIEKLVIDQLESEVLVRSSKEANTS
ncbi:hypothetical protein Tco_0502079, partial [Tanacetum coccineum]